MREIRLALLEADVNFEVVKDFVAQVRERAVGQEVLKSLTAGQQVVKAVHEELTALMGAGSSKLAFTGRPPTVILLAGLQGSGKTTAAAKLALLLRKEGRSPGLVAADLQRPAAIDQLEQRGPLRQGGDGPSDQADLGWREARPARVLPSGPDGVAHPRHGGRAHADRTRGAGSRGGRTGRARGQDAEGSVQLRRSAQDLPHDRQDGLDPEPAEADSRARKAARGHRPDRREAVRAGRGHDPLDDAEIGRAS